MKATAMLERADEFLSGAEEAVASERYNLAALCGYAALFWAAMAALTHVGVRRERWSHDGLRNTFITECVHKRRLYPERFGDWLRDAYELRSDAHYDWDGVSPKPVRRLVAHAREFVTKVKEVTQR